MQLPWKQVELTLAFVEENIAEIERDGQIY